jgi:hypothetical protein
MSSRPLIKPFPVIVNADMSTTITSEATIVDNISAISYDISWSGSSPTGTVSVEVSDTYKENSNGTAILVAGNWYTLPLSTTTNVSGNTGTGGIDVQITGFYAIRLQYVPSGGTGTMQATLAAKVH